MCRILVLTVLSFCSHTLLLIKLLQQNSQTLTNWTDQHAHRLVRWLSAEMIGKSKGNSARSGLLHVISSALTTHSRKPSSNVTAPSVCVSLSSLVSKTNSPTLATSDFSGRSVPGERIVQSFVCVLFFACSTSFFTIIFCRYFPTQLAMANGAFAIIKKHSQKLCAEKWKKQDFKCHMRKRTKEWRQTG